MIEVEISWAYTPVHRYDSDLDERAHNVLAEALIDLGGGKITETFGGVAIADGPDAFSADSGFCFTAPNLDTAETIRARVEQIVRFYDDRYRVTMRPSPTSSRPDGL